VSCQKTASDACERPQSPQTGRMARPDHALEGGLSGHWRHTVRTATLGQGSFTSPRRAVRTTGSLGGAPNRSPKGTNPPSTAGTVRTVLRSDLSAYRQPARDRRRPSGIRGAVIVELESTREAEERMERLQKKLASPAWFITVEGRWQREFLG
jgi:hypothetical protein